jgi:hypothetical protein
VTVVSVQFLRCFCFCLRLSRTFRRSSSAACCCALVSGFRFNVTLFAIVSSFRNSIQNWWPLFNSETINAEIFHVQHKPRCRACVRSKPLISQSLLCPRANRVVGETGIRSTGGPFQHKRSPIQSIVIPRSVQFIDSSVFCEVKLSSCNIE